MTDITKIVAYLTFQFDLSQIKTRLNFFRILWIQGCQNSSKFGVIKQKGNNFTANLLQTKLRIREAGTTLKQNLTV